MRVIVWMTLFQCIAKCGSTRFFKVSDDLENVHDFIESVINKEETPDWHLVTDSSL